MNLAVYCDIKDGKIKKSSLEALSTARKIADATSGNVSVILVGDSLDSAYDSVKRYGADHAIVAEDAVFKDYSPDIYTLAITKAIRSLTPDIILIAGTSSGKDIAPRVSARLDAPLISDATVYSIDSPTQITWKRPIYSGKAIASVISRTKTTIVTIRPNVFPLEESKKDTDIRKIDAGATQGDIRSRVVRFLAEVSEVQDIAEASIIVSGGRGMKGPENYKILYDFAKVLGGAVGASRAAVDSGWIDHSHQVGQTGKVVSPNLYIACGISGAIQHLAGMSSSKYIVAINKDPNAPIFKVSDYGIVGDLFEIVPLLTKSVAELKKN